MKRLNIKLAVWLVGITLVLVVGVHLLHGYQLERNADFLKRQAESAVEAGDSEEAIKYYSQFLKYRDEPESYSALANLVDESAQDPDAKRREWQRAYNILEEAVRRHPDLADVRRRLIEYTIRARRFPDALGHIKRLEDPQAFDPSLEFLKARCYAQSGEEDQAIKVLYSLLGFDEETQQFAEEPGKGAKEIQAYALLAAALGRKSDGAARADAVMDQLVIDNPDSAEAHLLRAQHVATTTEAASAKSNLDRAFALAPDDPDVILSMAAFAIEEKDFAHAHELLDRALKMHPERQGVYVRLAQLALAEKEPQKGIEHLELGLKDADQVQLILPMLLELQLAASDVDAARATCDEMEKRDVFPPVFQRFSRARIQFAEKNYWAASREFEAVRPALARSAYGAQSMSRLEILLGGCYEALGLHDRQLEVARRMLRSNAGQAGALLSEAFALQRLGRYDEAIRDLDVLMANVETFPNLRLPVFQLLTSDQLRRPKERRDWALVEQLVQQLYDDPSRSEMDNTLLKGELLLAQDRLDESQTVLGNARKQNPKDVRAWTSLVKLLRQMDRHDNVAPLLDLAEKEVGDVFALRLERIRLLVLEGGDAAVAGLQQLEQNVDHFTESERVALTAQIGAAFLKLNHFDGAKRCWSYATEHDPTNAQIRQVLFELMSDTKDDAGMQSVLKGIHDSTNWGPQSPLYKYCKAMSLVRPLSTRDRRKAAELTQTDRKSLIDARRLIDEAIQVRTEWGILWRVRGEIDELEGDVNAAIASYQRALDCSHTGQTIVARRLVRLLSATNRFAEADKVLQYVGQLSATDPLNKVIQRETLNKGDIAGALSMAQVDVDEDPQNPANQIWLAHVLEQAGRIEEAEARYRKAVEVGPNLPQTWLLLVQHLMANRRTVDAAEVIRQATPKMEQSAVTLALLHELVGDQRQAESFYRAAVTANPDDIAVLRRVAEYYVKRARTGPAPQFQQEVRKAAPYLGQIVEKTKSSEDPESVRLLGWARRGQAEIIAVGGTYDDIIRATKLIERNARDGKLPVVDIQAIVDLLAKRPEPASRAKAVRLLEQLANRPDHSFQHRERLLLGQLLELQGNWDDARERMVTSLTKNRNDPDTLLAFVRSLTKHGEYDEASRWLDTFDDVLSKLAPSVRGNYKSATIEVRARLLVKQGEPEQAVAVLKQLIPSPLPPGQLYRLEKVSMLLEQLEQYDAARQLLKEYVGQDPRGTIAMAAFLGRRGEVDQAFTMLEESRSNQSVIEILAVALDTLRRHPDEATPERFKTLENWATAALSAEGNVQQVKLLVAEMYDLQGRYDDVVKIYREILAAEDTTVDQAAKVKNNLAFVLAVTEQELPEALKLIDESIHVIGPQSALLDTRGLVQLNQGNVDAAIADFRVSSADSPTKAKYFHLALAEQKANNLDAARDAIALAEEFGDSLLGMTPLEQKAYQRLVIELK